MKYLKQTMIVFAALIAVVIGFGIAQTFGWSWTSEFGVAYCILGAVLLVFCVLIIIGMCGHKFDVKKLGSYFLHFGFILFLIGCLLYEITGVYITPSNNSAGGIYSYSGPYYTLAKESDDGSVEEIDLGFGFKTLNYEIDYYDPIYEVVKVTSNGNVTLMENVTWDDNGYFNFGEYGKFNKQNLVDPDGNGTYYQQIALAQNVYAIYTPVAKEYRAVVQIIQDGKEIRTEVLRVNHPVRANGYKIYLMGMSSDWTTATIAFKKDIGEYFSLAGIICVMFGTAFHCLVYPVIKSKTKNNLPLKTESKGVSNT